ncbi:MAG TPA: ABC transporter permease [Streptosporangiaceae bacterium]|nr:ABC transporter permease [Streptosporangiaceae bacterium]
MADIAAQTAPGQTAQGQTAPGQTASGQTAQGRPRRLPGLGPVLATQVRYSLTMLIRNPRALVAGLVLPGALLALQAGKAEHVTMAAAAPRIAGLIAFSAAAIAFFTHANTLVIAREEGVLRRWRVSPLPAWAYFAGRIVAATLLTVAAGLVLVFVAMGMTGLHFSGHEIAGLLADDVLGALALVALGIALTPLITSAQAAQPMLMLIYFPLVILSGEVGSITDLPHWLTTTMTYLPAQPLVDAISGVLHGGALMSGHDLAVLAGWTVGGLLISYRFFQWDPHRPAHARRPEGSTTARSA